MSEIREDLPVVVSRASTFLDLRGQPSAVSNDEHRFRALYDEHFSALTRYVVRRIHTPANAADVVAETFLVLWRKLDQVPQGRELPWLYGVARRVLANHRRGERRQDQLVGKLGEEIVTAAQDVDPDRETAREEIQAVLAAVARMSATDQEVLRLVAWEGLSREEVATTLGCSRATARVRLHRARTRLRRELQRQATEHIGAQTTEQDQGQAAQREETRP